MNNVATVRDLLVVARRECVVTPAMVRCAWELSAPMRLLWGAAGAGLAAFHKLQGKAYDLEAELGDDAEKLPRAYFEGYALEALRGDHETINE